MSFRSVVILGNFCFPPSPAYSVWQVMEEQVHILAAQGLTVKVLSQGKGKTPAHWPRKASLSTVPSVDHFTSDYLSRRLGKNALIITHDLIVTRWGLELIE